MLAYGLTIFIGAFLLFQVQPLIAKFLLPWFGGGPAVWTTCMLFFQVVLLGGYAYAHALTRYFKPRTQAVFHLLLLVVALACLPIVPSDSWKPLGNKSPSFAILFLLACNVGVPYFVLSSTGPLIQRWCCRPSLVSSPYRLYALSNLGSLLALTSYPLFFEVHFPLKTQAVVWEWCLVGYTIVCGFCAVKLGRSPPRLAGAQPSEPGIHARPGSEQVQNGAVLGLRRVLWLLWSACASILFLATTNKLCLDVAVFPFLWVLPLGLYLLSFVLCFASPRFYLRLTFTFCLGAAMICICWALFKAQGWSFWAQVCAYSASLFVCCLVCHGELYRIRPAPELLTEFYLLVAGGGALGGLLVSVLAPVLFTNYYELHWGLVLCGFLLAAVRSIEALGVSLSSAPRDPDEAGRARAKVTWSLLDWQRLGLTLTWLCVFGLATTLWLQARRPGADIVHKSRNFYGVLTVFEHRKEEPKAHHFLLQHGRITHGFQFVDPLLQTRPTTYYGPDSGVGLAFKSLPAGPRHVGVIGLGTGTLAAYARPADLFHFYEIDPQVWNLATSRFTYLARCRGRCEVTLGDARLSLERASRQGFDLLALDAFSSDSIPIHLLTKEAFQLYLAHVKPAGVIAVHISNHFLDLEPIVLGIASHLHLHTALIDHDAKPEQWWIYSSSWILLCRDDQVLNQSSISSAVTTRLGKTRDIPFWTDDFSSALQILR